MSPIFEHLDEEISSLSEFASVCTSASDTIANTAWPNFSVAGLVNSAQRSSLPRFVGRTALCQILKELKRY